MMTSVAEKINHTQIRSGWMTESLFVDGDDYFSEVFSSIQKAQHSIYLESYIFESDSLGRRLMRALLDAQNRGVDVKLLIDGVGSANFIAMTLRDTHYSGLDIRVYHPLPWQIPPHFAVGKPSGLRTLLRFFSYANSRNHRKVIVIDNSTAFVGSLNVSDFHCAEFLGQNAWHDYGVKVQGVLCQVLNSAFLKIWKSGWRLTEQGFLKPPIPLQGSSIIPDSQFIVRNDGAKLRHKALNRRLLAIRQAKRRIWIANAYFVPAGQLLRALMAAAKRGIDVRILLPTISDVRFMPWVSRAFYESLIKYGVKVYEYGPRVLHAKAMLVDDHCWIGSANLNHRSLLHDYELDVILSSPGVVQKLEKNFREDFLKSRLIDKISTYRQPWFQRLAVNILLYFRHLL